MYVDSVDCKCIASCQGLHRVLGNLLIVVSLFPLHQPSAPAYPSLNYWQ